MVARAVMVADHGAAANGVPQINRHKGKVHIHNNPISRNPIFPRQLHKLEIVQDIYDGCGKVRHHFGRAIPKYL